MEFDKRVNCRKALDICGIRTGTLYVETNEDFICAYKKELYDTHCKGCVFAMKHNVLEEIKTLYVDNRIARGRKREFGISCLKIAIILHFQYPKKYPLLIEKNPADICAGCRRDDVKVKLCVGCHATKYCSIECQKQHWSEHRLDCMYRTNL